MAAVSVIKNATKLVIGGGAVYATVQQGVWSTDTTQGSKVLDTVRTTVAPTASEYIARLFGTSSGEKGQAGKQTDRRNIPSTREVNNSVVSMWNRGVTATFSTIADAPEYGKKAVVSTKKMLTDK